MFFSVTGFLFNGHVNSCNCDMTFCVRLSRFLRASQMYVTFWSVNFILGFHFTQKSSFLICFLNTGLFFHKSFPQHGRVDMKLLHNCWGENKAARISSRIWLRCFQEIENGPIPWAGGFPTANCSSLVHCLTRQGKIF